MSRTKIDPLFSYWRADEVAECLEIPSVISEYLWNHIVPLQGEIPFREEPTYEQPLRKFWSKLPEEYKRQLNKAAHKHIMTS